MGSGPSRGWSVEERFEREAIRLEIFAGRNAAKICKSREDIDVCSKGFDITPANEAASRPMHEEGNPVAAIVN
jgi:hypothetical protein